MSFSSTKTYDHNEGLSCVFRQWKADGTHCKFLHGYALKFRVVFGCHQLDDRNWVQNFGGLKEFKEWLHETFDHKMLVAQDDPARQTLEQLGLFGLAQVVVVPRVGCEAVAEMAFNWLIGFLNNPGNQIDDITSSGTAFKKKRVWVESVEVYEHSGNSAIYKKD